jgi:hypothetical protein
LKTVTAVIVLTVLAPLSATAQTKPLGWLSSTQEVGNRGPQTISPGENDPGGISYGSFQFASQRGVGKSSTVKTFVDEYYAEDFREPDAGKPDSFKEIAPGTPEFETKWKEVVKREGEEFVNNEREFIFDTHYTPVVNAIKEKLGLDVDARGDTLRNVLWSTAVQNGPPSDPRGSAVQVIEAALKQWDKKQLSEKPGPDGKGGVSDEDLINAIYAERFRKGDDGQMIHFPKVDLKKSRLDKRAVNERKDALAALTQERETQAPDLNKTALGILLKKAGIIAMPDRRKPNLLAVPRGQVTFDGEGNEGGPYHSRRPHVPSDKSGVTIGRGYDMKKRTAKEIQDDLRAAGVSEAQAKLYAEAAGLSGADAKAFLEKHGGSALFKAAKELGLKGREVNQYLKDNTLEEISQQQQKDLFDLTYGRMEAAVKDKFADYAKYPPSAQEALTDMAYNLGVNGLRTKFPKFVEDVRKQEWDKAAQESKRKGVGAERNQAVRKLLEQAAQPAPAVPKPLP